MDVADTDQVSRVEANWVPADACHLPTAEQPARLAAFEQVFSSDVREVMRPQETQLRLVLDPTPAVAARVAQLAHSEADCCGFFRFMLTAEQGQLSLGIEVPPQRINVLDGVAAQAEEARCER